MKTKVNLDEHPKTNSRFLWLTVIGGIFLFLTLFLHFLSKDELAVENYYSKGFYPLFSNFSKLLFGWVPISVGDFLYIVFVGLICFFFFSSLLALRRKKHRLFLFRGVQLIVLILGIYSFFYMSWGQNYFRVPLQKQLSLNVAGVTQEEYTAVLERYIDSLNSIREVLNLVDQNREIAVVDIQKLMFDSKQQLPMLSDTQIKVKYPVSSHLVSFFTVTGYFNPFTQEVQVNQLMPKTSYPFTVAHELAHQMGIGFEDECNFVAFLVLHNDSNSWYRYAAYYETVQYLLRPLFYQDRLLYNNYANLLSEKVKSDLYKDQEFWKSYYGWINQLSSFFYSGYLRHNNQPEGVARYTLMGRLVVAWENNKNKTFPGN